MIAHDNLAFGKVNSEISVDKSEGSGSCQLYKLYQAVQKIISTPQTPYYYQHYRYHFVLNSETNMRQDLAIYPSSDNV